MTDEAATGNEEEGAAGASAGDDDDADIAACIASLKDLIKNGRAEGSKSVSRNIKERIGSPFGPSVNAMRRMEVSYDTFEFGTIIQCNLCTLSLPRVAM